MKIYHGSQSVIEVPQYGLGKAGNDFGLGFYCAESEDLAKEWSVQPHRDGFANAYDIIIGYRADDSYFDFAEAFLNNSISVEQLAVALRLGKLGEQVVVKSREAFGRLNSAGFTTAEAAVYYPRRQARNDDAGREFGELLAKNDFNGLYMNAILAQRIGNDDERIPRNAAP